MEIYSLLNICCWVPSKYKKDAEMLVAQEGCVIITGVLRATGESNVFEGLEQEKEKQGFQERGNYDRTQSSLHHPKNL